MNAVLILVGLLVLSYLGSFLVGGRSVRGVGLPSGVEYAALGFVLGPHALGLVGADNLAAFEPVVQVALGWLAFVIGLDFGFTGNKRVRASSLVLGSLSALLAGGGAAGAAWLTMQRLGVGGSSTERILLAGGAGAACSQTTRHAIRWVVDRHEGRGPLAERIDEIAHADDFFPLLAVAVLFAFEPAHGIAVSMPLRDWPAVTVGLGLLLGAGAALLLRSEMPIEDTWAVLFGVSLIAIGCATRLAISTLTVCFFMGMAVSLLTSHHAALRAMVGPTERPVLLPALVLAGARIDFRASTALPWIAAAAIAGRIVAKVVTGWLLTAGSSQARKAGPLVGLSLMSSGALAMCIGLAFALRFPGLVGDTVLVVSALAATVGEFVGPTRLRRALLAAGEIVEASKASSSDAKSAVSVDPSMASHPEEAKPSSESSSARGGGGGLSAPASAPRRGIGVHLTHLLLLAAFSALIFYVTRVVPDTQGSLWTIAAIGFLLLSGTLLSELLAPLGLPHLTGYLIAGIASGPYALKLVDEHTVKTLSPINTLALSLIALAGGAELDLATVRKSARSLGWAMLVQCVFVLVAVTTLFFLVARPMIPFTRSLAAPALLGVSLLWGALAVTRSPSATLGILSQTRASGPLATFTLAFVMTSDVVVVVLVALVLGCVRPLIDPSAGFSLDSFASLGHEIVGSVALGTTLGLVIALYLRLVNRQMLVVLLVLGFGVSTVIDYLQFDALLTFIVAGFIVRNMSNQGHKFTAYIEKTGTVVYVIFFATAGADLNVPLLRELWPVALMLAGTRAFVTWLGSPISGRLAGDSAVLRRWSWSGLVSQAGLALGLSAIIAREFPSIGTGFRALAIATVAINEMVGPVLFKFALDRTRETSPIQAPSFPSMRPPGMP